MKQSGSLLGQLSNVQVEAKARAVAAQNQGGGKEVVVEVEDDLWGG